MHELFGNFGHDSSEENNHDHNRHRSQHAGVDQRLNEFAADFLPIFIVISQFFQHRGQQPGAQGDGPLEDPHRQGREQHPLAIDRGQHHHHDPVDDRLGV